MTAPQTRSEIIARLDEVGHGIRQTIEGLSAPDFERDTPEEWSASGYLQHLILSVKPVAKALAMPAEQMLTMFGQPDHASRTYDQMTATYQAGIAQVLPPGTVNPLEPSTYRFPEGTTDRKAYLAETWSESHQRLIHALEAWGEVDLDSYQLPHPAIGMLTLREMLFFTVFHNTLHWGDIRRVSGITS